MQDLVTKNQHLEEPVKNKLSFLLEQFQDLTKYSLDIKLISENGHTNDVKSFGSTFYLHDL